MALRLILRTALLAALSALFFAPAALAAKGLIRDTEIEADIHRMMTPIWEAAGLDPDAVHVYLLDDDQINSFVAGGQNIFINTGLVRRAKTPDMLLGVLAHETGHIALGHLTRAGEAMKNASIEGIVAMVLGAAAAIASHSDQSGAAMLPGALVAERAWLRYSVTQEASADQAALSYLDRTHQSSRGLLKFFERLQTEELLEGDHLDPYLRDHPLTSQRIEYLREHVAHSPYSNAPDPPQYAAMLKLIKMKLAAFLSPPGTTLARYPESDNSLLARYARAIAYYRVPQLDEALPIIDGLIRDHPHNPFFEELKGQMLFENGRVKEAIAPYDAAVRLDPGAALLRISRAQVYIESQEPRLDKPAIADLNEALRSEDKDSGAWHLLAIAYGRDGQKGKAALALAEEGLVAGKKKDTLFEVARAERLLPKDSASYARAEEIKREAKELKEPKATD
ncbi:MAG TPA: M48 family metalloprotease [Stellaceae bacterium]|nr:M48 family metalloprotease [Stellaceae bacterium]